MSGKFKDNTHSALGTKSYDPIHNLIYGKYKGKITEISFNGPHDGWVSHIEHGYVRIPRAELKFATLGYFVALCETFAANMGILFDERYPVVACPTPDGDRFHAVIGSSVDTGLAVSIRVKRMKKITWDDFEVSLEHQDLIESTIARGGSILLSGGTGSGKTTFQNMLCGFIPPGDKIITIEDTREIILTHENKVHLTVSRTRGVSDLTWGDQIESCLRLNPDDIIPGELSISSALPTMKAMDTGHDSIITTMHANTPVDAISGFRRRVSMGGADTSDVSDVEEFLASNVDLIIQIKHLRHDTNNQRRAVTEVVVPRDILVDRDAIRAAEGSLSPTDAMITAAAYAGTLVNSEEAERIREGSNRVEKDYT